MILHSREGLGIMCMGVLAIITICAGHHMYTERTDDKVSTDLVAHSVYSQVTTRLPESNIEVSTIDFSDLDMVYSDTVHDDGDTTVAEWVGSENTQMLKLAVMGTWHSKYVTDGHNIWLCTKAMKVPSVDVTFSDDGASISVDGEAAEPVSCSVAGNSIECVGGTSFLISSDGCLEYSCDTYSLILVRE